MFDFLTQGGTFMWVLLGWSILGLGFIIERVRRAVVPLPHRRR